MESAFDASAFYTYKALKLSVEALLKNGLYRTRTLPQTQIQFNEYGRHGYDPVYEAQESELQNIWEERMPSIKFASDAEPIAYIKKNDGLQQERPFKGEVFRAAAK